MDFTDRRHRAALIAAISGGLILLILIGIGLYGLITGPHNPSESPSTQTPNISAPVRTPSARHDSGPQPVATSSDPQATALAIVSALFTWDTTSGYGPADYAQVLADVTAAVEADAAASDVRAYLPTPASWAQLRTHQTRQWITVTDIEVPSAWETAVEQAAPGQILPGMTAYTVTGTRHRAGTWSSEPIEAERPVTFTVFLMCGEAPPNSESDEGAAQDADGSCELLRLSHLDTPLR